MENLLAYITLAGTILEAGVALIDDAQKIGTLIKGVVDKGEPAAADWDALHAFETTATADLDAPMEGEGQ